MGGRSGKGAASLGQRSKAKKKAAQPKLQIVRETEKAIQTEVSAYVEFAPTGGFTSSMVKDRTYNLKVWLPKSQIKDGVPSDWIKQQKENDLLNDDWLNTRFMNGRPVSVKIDFKYQ